MPTLSCPQHTTSPERCLRTTLVPWDLHGLLSNCKRETPIKELPRKGLEEAVSTAIRSLTSCCCQAGAVAQSGIYSELRSAPAAQPTPRRRCSLSFCEELRS